MVTPMINALSPRPLVSVAVPARNEGEHIEACLTSILNQNYPSDRMEVLVVDGFSTDDTRARVASLRDPRLRILDNPERTVPHAMNRAIREARGEILVRVDAHTRIAAEYVREAVDLLQRSWAWGVGGSMTAVGATTFGRAVALATSSRFGIGDSAFHYARRECEAESVYMGAYRISVLRGLGGYDGELTRNQDDELNARIRTHGGRIVLSPRLRSEYTCRGTPGSVTRQYFQYGSWKVRSLRKSPGGFRLRHAVPPLFVAGLAAGPAASIAAPELRLAFGAVLVAYAVLAALAAARILRRGKDPAAAARTLHVFPILHLAYGAGVWHGMVRFRLGRRAAGAPVEVRRVA